MRNTKIVSGIFALMVLGSLAVLGGSPKIMGGLIEYIQKNSIGNILSSVNSRQQYDSGDASVSEAASFIKTVENVNAKTEEIPDEILWRVILGFPEKFNALAEDARAAGQDERLYTEYFTRQANLSVENAEIFKQTAVEYAAELSPLEDRIQSIGRYRKTARDQGQNLSMEESYTLRQELLTLQDRQKEIVLKYRDKFRNAVDAESFTVFENWLRNDFSASFTSKRITSSDLSADPNSNVQNNGFERMEKPKQEENQK